MAKSPLAKKYIKAAKGDFKKAWALQRAAIKKRKSGGGKAKAKPKGKSGGRKVARTKKLSLSGTLAVGGVALLVTGIGAKKVDDLIASIDAYSTMIGITTTVTGASLLAAAVGLKLAASFSVWFGRRYRGFLAGYGLRP